MPRKPRSRSGKRKKRSSIKKNRIRLWMLQLTVISLCCFASYCLWLDFRVRTEFQGTRWALPARVYASPLELYVGKSITKQNLVNELKSLGYQAVSRVWRTGQFSVAGN